MHMTFLYELKLNVGHLRFEILSSPLHSPPSHSLSVKLLMDQYGLLHDNLYLRLTYCVHILFSSIRS